MGEAKRREKNGDPTYQLPKEARDFEARNQARAAGRGQRDWSPDESKALPFVALAPPKKTGKAPRLSRAQRRAQRGSRAS